jgi:UDP-glucose 4-epimerase
MYRCLVTGADGYIGSHLVRELEKRGHQVVGIDYKNDAEQDLMHCLDSNPHYSSFKPEVIFHLACIPRVAYSVENPALTMENNVLSTTKVLDFARKVGAKRVVYSGSSSVVGNGDGPTSPYGLQKLISEMECKLYSELYGLDTVTLRYFNVYSPDQKAEGAYATAVSNFMQHIRDGKNPFITGTGEQRRDMAHVSDVVSANIFAMNYKEDFNGKYFDIGTGDNISLNQISEVVKKHFPKVEFSYVETRKGDIMFTKADINPIMEIGWEPMMKIKKGVEECFIELKKGIKNE